MEIVICIIAYFIIAVPLVLFLAIVLVAGRGE